ncbi:haloacid dehalogenase [Pedobacter nanyangensis]|uniref:haloacid dehalogenase n=1 Tax=Pedobacter nanyangensis TaxID=1562389 RepID=UPI00196335D8|nr:haloacid dehalogenase [Pedobacter nanyangensis]
MSFEKYLTDKKALILTLDDALFPKKDYLLQVYYLFSEFMAYTEQHDSKAMIDFMSKTYAAEGSENIFDKTAEQFAIPEKYRHNFELLHETARLPLKLLLFQNVLCLLQEAVVNRIQIFLLAEGNPAEAINKIKQVEWHGLQEYLKIYFTAEYGHSINNALQGMLIEQVVEKDVVVMFVSESQFKSGLAGFGLECFSVTEIL